MNKPIIAIIGRPNVGKSSLFNKLLRRRQAIVSPVSGTTRDRLYATLELDGIVFDLVDTAGLTRELANEDFGHEMLAQIQLAVAEADGLIFVLDAQSGYTSMDQELAEIIRKADTPTLVFVNKADDITSTIDKKLMSTGIGDTIVGSLAQRRGIQELQAKLTNLLSKLPKQTKIDHEASKYHRVALAGRPNVGKSTLFNALANEERVIVSDIPGTTRDAIDTLITLPDGSGLILTDTAGLRRRGKVGRAPKVERYSVLRTLRAIDQSDLVLLLVDATEGLTRGDAHIATYTLEQKKRLVTVINKSDLIDTTQFNLRRFPFIARQPMIFISALEKVNVDELLELIQRSLAEIQGRNREVEIPPATLDQ